MATTNHFYFNKWNHFQIKIELAIEWKTHEPKCGVHNNILNNKNNHEIIILLLLLKIAVLMYYNNIRYDNIKINKYI